METQKQIMLILDSLIIIIIAVGFIYLRKYIKSHPDEKVEAIEKPVSRMIIIIGVSIVILSFIVMSIGIFSKILN